MADQPASLRIVRLRLAKLNPATNAPANGTQNGYVSSQMVSLQIAPQVTTGAEITQNNGAGAVCVSAKANDQPKRIDLTLTMCANDPYVANFLTGAALFNITTAGTAHGWQMPAGGVDNTTVACLEAWAYAWAGTSQVISAATTPNVAWEHYVFPLTKGWTLGTTTLQDGSTVFQYTGQANDNSAITLNGPFNDWPSYIFDEGGVTTSMGVFEDGTIPSATTGFVALPAGS